MGGLIDFLIATYILTKQ